MNVNNTRDMAAQSLPGIESKPIFHPTKLAKAAWMGSILQSASSMSFPPPKSSVERLTGQVGTQS